VNPADCPGESVFGNVIPLSANSVLVLDAEEIVTDDPLALSIPVKDALVPVVTFPKFKAIGDRVNCPAVAPVPERPMLS